MLSLSFNRLVGVGLEERSANLAARPLGRVPLFSVLVLVNIIGVQYSLLGIAVGCASAAAVVFCLLMKEARTAFLWLVVLASCSFESEAYTLGVSSEERLYGFSSMPLVGSFLCILLLVVCYAMLVWKDKPSRESLALHPMLRMVNILANVVLVSGVVFFAVSYIANDNNVSNLSWYLGTILGETAKGVFGLFVLKFVAVQLLLDGLFSQELKGTITDLLVAFAWMGALAAVMGWHGYYYSDHTEVALLPLAHIFSSSLVLIGLFEKGLRKVLCIVSGIVSLVTLLAVCPSPLSGTWATMQVFLVANVLLVMLKPRKFAIVGVAVVLAAVLLPSALKSMEADQLVQYKFGQAVDLVIGFATGADVSDSAHSAYTRVDELMNVALEYGEKPQYVLFGKGFGGSTAHYTNSEWNSQGDFSIEQVLSGTFIRLHTSPSQLFLKHGLVGLMLFAVLFAYGMMNARKSPWLFSGLFWLTFYYSSFATLALIGASALVLGVYDAECARANREKSIGES